MHAATWLFTSLSGARVSSSRLRIAVVPRSRACYLPVASGQWPVASGASPLFPSSQREARHCAKHAHPAV